MQGMTLLKRRAQGAVQPVLQIKSALPLDDVCEQVAVESGLLGQQGSQVEVVFGGDELIEADHTGRDMGPVPSRLQSVRRIGTSVAHGSEDHGVSLGAQGRLHLRTRRASFADAGELIGGG
jgi:hypothetical protein